ncbi:MAG: MFS transporter [Verrucomicrobiales bacterium]
MSELDFEPSRRHWGSFWSLTGMQTLNAFNDNVAKFVLIPFGVGLAAAGQAFQGIQHVLVLLLVLPFIILAPTAGWLADRFPKNRIIVWSAWFQFTVLALMVWGLWMGLRGSALLGLWVAVFAYFLLAVQSALLSPSKMGVVKELVGSRRLGFANGVMEGTVILAILGGQIVGGIWYDSWGLAAGKNEWAAALTPVFWIWMGGIFSLFLAHAMMRTPARQPEPYGPKVAFGHFRDVRSLLRERSLRLSAWGVAFFWGFGGMLNLVVIQLATERYGTSEGFGTGNALLWAMAVVGIAGGSLVASLICRKRNELGLIVLGGAMLALGNFAMVALLPWEGWFKLALAFTGVGAAFFFVPLNAFLQDEAPDDERGKVISASNLLNNGAGVLAVALQFAMEFLGVPVWGQLLFLGVICAAATVYVARLLPRDFVRLLVLGVLRLVYRVRVLGEERLPRVGGVLLLPNHLSYLDALLLQAACPREIRFVMIDDCFERKWLGRGARLFRTVPISPKRAKEAVAIVAEALEAGAVVCLFPEGQLSRTGAMSELKRGYELMARRAEAVVVPAYLDGLWGSMWSFIGNRFLKKWPRKLRYGVTVAFGDAVRGREMPVGRLRRELSALSRETLLQRTREATAKGGDESLTANALQLAQVNVACWENRLLIERGGGDELEEILGTLWPEMIGARVSFVEAGASVAEILAETERFSADRVILHRVQGRENLAGKLSGLGAQVHFFAEDFPGGSEGLFGGLVRDGRVLSFSLPHPDYETTTMIFQPGWKEGALARLLPGFSYEEEEGGLRLRGPALSGELFLAGMRLDEEGFFTRDHE